VLAILVFGTCESVGHGPLKQAWVNFDRVWAIALLLAGRVCHAIALADNGVVREVATSH